MSSTVHDASIQPKTLVTMFLVATILSVPGYYFGSFFNVNYKGFLSVDIISAIFFAAVLNIAFWGRVLLLAFVFFAELINSLPFGVTIFDFFEGSIKSIHSASNGFKLSLIISVAGLLFLWPLAIKPVILVKNLSLRFFLFYIGILATCLFLFKTFEVSVFRSPLKSIAAQLVLDQNLLFNKFKPEVRAVKFKNLNSRLYNYISSYNEPTVAIIVESWGISNKNDVSAELKLLQLSRQCAASEIEYGNDLFPGYTIQMEVAQLCSASIDSFRFDASRLECLPKITKYKSYAYHNNTLDFYRRNKFYPDIGFSKSFGRSEMGLPPAPSLPFSSATDEQVADFLIKNAKDNTGFHYWMTLDMHSPYDSNRLFSKDYRVISNEEIDRYYVYNSLKSKTFKTLGKMIKELPDYNFFIIGDHAPRFFSPALDSIFDKTKVPFVYIRHC